MPSQPAQPDDSGSAGPIAVAGGPTAPALASAPTPTPPQMADAVRRFGLDPGPPWVEMEPGRAAFAVSQRSRRSLSLAGVLMLAAYLAFHVFAGGPGRTAAGIRAAGPLPLATGGAVITDRSADFRPSPDPPVAGQRLVGAAAGDVPSPRGGATSPHVIKPRTVQAIGAAMMAVCLTRFAVVVVDRRRRKRRFARAEGWADPVTGAPLALPLDRAAAERAVQARLFAALFVAPYRTWTEARRTLPTDGAFVRGNRLVLRACTWRGTIAFAAAVLGAGMITLDPWRHPDWLSVGLTLAPWPIIVVVILGFTAVRTAGTEQRCVQCRHAVPPAPAPVPADCPECARSWRWPGSILTGQWKVRWGRMTVLCAVVLLLPYLLEIAALRPGALTRHWLPTGYHVFAASVDPGHAARYDQSSLDPPRLRRDDLDRLVPIVTGTMVDRVPQPPTGIFGRTWRGDVWLADAVATGRVSDDVVDGLAGELVTAELPALRRGPDGRVYAELRVRGWRPSGPGAPDVGVVVSEIGLGDEASMVPPDVRDRWTRPRRPGQFTIDWVDERFAGKVILAAGGAPFADGPIAVASSLYLRVPASLDAVAATLEPGARVRVRVRVERLIQFDRLAATTIGATWTADGRPAVTAEHSVSTVLEADLRWPE